MPVVLQGASRSLIAAATLALATVPGVLTAQPARLLRQPTISATSIAFEYGGDLWLVARGGGDARRLTSTAQMESDPHFSPDGKWIAFTSTRSGAPGVYVMSTDGGDARRLTWNPSPSSARGWTPDGRQVLYASSAGSAPTGYNRLYTVPVEGGPPKLIPEPMAMRGDFSADGKRIVVDRVTRWDVEFRNYRGGQNTPLTILDLATLEETRLPNDRSGDIHPVWLGDAIYFISDRDFAQNVWSYDTRTKALKQVTHVKDADVKTLSGGGGMLVFEQDGWIHTLDPATGQSRRVDINVRGDFPWAMPVWKDVAATISGASLSATGKRALFESRGEIFTVPVEKGDTRNLTRSPGAADHAPVWSPDGKQVAWFSDSGSGYVLRIGAQEGVTPTRDIPVGESKMAWAPAWSPDGSRIAFVDGRAHLRVVEVATGKIVTADTDGGIQDRAAASPTWSPDSKWLAYAKVMPNQFRRIMVWSLADGTTHALTDGLASASNPAWDRNGKYLYFLASTDLGMTSGWADLSSVTRRSTQGVYLLLLRAGESSPLLPESDDETVSPAKREGADTAKVTVTIDFSRPDRRTIALPLPVRDYAAIATGATGVLFVTERVPNQQGATIHRFDLAKRKTDVFVTGAQLASTSADGKKLLYRQLQNWFVVGTDAPPTAAAPGRLTVNLQMRLDPAQEWKQIFEEAWRMERDFFYAPNTHGADWPAVHARYAPLIPYVRHREDLTYILDMLGGELSVGHSFTGGGDVPAGEDTRPGMLGADLVADGTRWRIARIFTSESWNPELKAPLDAPGVRAAAGHYLLAINGVGLTTADDPYRLLDGTADRQTVLTLNDRPVEDGAWTATVVPVRNESGLRTRAWVEDNRRRVDSLSNGKLAYVWVPNTGNGAIQSFDRYYFAQQDKDGAVIDERFNGGGNLDDYMVMLMSRRIVGGITNDAPGGTPFKVPVGGVPGPKVLVTNELAGSGGDFFPWVFRTLQVGPLVGTRTWGGLVASCVPYLLVDNGFITSPCSGVYDANGKWVAEGVGVPPDIEVLQDAKSISVGRDPQLERAVLEGLKLMSSRGEKRAVPGAFPTPARRP